MRYRYEASPLTIVLLHLVQAVLIDGQSSEEYTTAVRNVTKRPYKPVEEFKGRHFLDQMAEELTFQHKHVIVKRAAAMKRKHKDQEVTKKRLPRTTRVKSKFNELSFTRTTTTTKWHFYLIRKFGIHHWFAFHWMKWVQKKKLNLVWMIGPRCLWNILSELDEI